MVMWNRAVDVARQRALPRDRQPDMSVINGVALTTLKWHPCQ